MLVMLIRNSKKIVPNGSTVIASGDTLILSGKSGDSAQGVKLYEKTVGKHDPWANKPISKIPSGKKLIIMVRRGENIIIPNGDTVLLEKDVLVINDPEVA